MFKLLFHLQKCLSLFLTFLSFQPPISYLYNLKIMLLCFVSVFPFPLLPLPLYSKKMLHSLLQLWSITLQLIDLLKITAIIRPALSFVGPGAELIRAPCPACTMRCELHFHLCCYFCFLALFSWAFLPFSQVQYHHLYQKMRQSINSVWEPPTSFICIPFSVLFLFVIYVVEESFVIFCDILWIPWR